MVSMFFRQKAIPFFLCLLLAFAVVAMPAVAAATTIREPNQAALFAQIERLLAEVARLQALLTKIQNEGSGTTQLADYVPYDSVLFPVTFESKYLVADGRLYNTVPGEGVDPTDAKLFALFVDTIGKENVERYIKEWRVFYQPESDLGAFVEYIPKEDAWLAGVNREGFVAGNTEITTSFANLFIHELAHVVLFEKPDFETDFVEKFWNDVDTLHAEKVEQTTSANLFSVLNRYYQNNTTRFVSDYATLNPSEDTAETFLAFVRDNKPSGVSTREQKIRTFYTEADLVSLRGVLRANLIALGAL